VYSSDRFKALSEAASALRSRRLSQGYLWPESTARIIIVNRGETTARNVIVDVQSMTSYRIKQGLQETQDVESSGRIQIGDLLPNERVDIRAWSDRHAIAKQDVFITSDGGEAPIAEHVRVPASEVESLSNYRQYLKALTTIFFAIVLIGTLWGIGAFLEQRLGKSAEPEGEAASCDASSKTTPADAQLTQTVEAAVEVEPKDDRPKKGTREGPGVEQAALGSRHD